MSSIKPITSKFENIASIVNYLREPSPLEVVSSTTTSSTVGSTRINNGLKSTKKQKKEKELANVINSMQVNSGENGHLLSSGRVRYGPITVNPRKQPSKTLFTGRRSKYEPLPDDEEEKRRVRRERNRTAATKCREKRENVLMDLENEHYREAQNYTQLSQTIKELEQRKQYLQSLLANHVQTCSLQKMNTTPPSQQPSSIFSSPAVLTSIMETPAPAFSPHQLHNMTKDEEGLNNFLQPTLMLTNSACDNDQLNNFFLSDQQSQQPTITMNSSSIERLINSLQSPTPNTDNNNNNNNNFSGLYNSAYGSSTCAQQHSSSSEDDSYPSVHKNPYVC